MDALHIRNIDDDLWDQVKEKATAEGRTIRGLILWLLQKYVANKIR